MAKFMLEIVTPDRVFYKQETDMIIIRGLEGEMGILRDHEPFVTPLDIGQVRIKNDGQIKIAALSVILSDTAEWPEEIDIERAEKAKERAAKRLEQKPEGLDILRAEIALKKAAIRIGTAKINQRH